MTQKSRLTLITAITNDNTAGSASYQSILSGAGSRSNPRVVQLIVTPSTTESSNGTYDTVVQAFAPAYLEQIFLQDVPGSNKNEADLILRIRFLLPAIAGEGEAQFNPDAPIGGIRIASLIEQGFSNYSRSLSGNLSSIWPVSIPLA